MLILSLLLYFVGFLALESVRNQHALKLDRRSIHYVLDHNYDAALLQINKAIWLNPNNPVFYANRGLIYERKIENNVYNDLLKRRFNCKIENKIKLDKSIREYKRALNLNPFDDIFYHNISWLHLYYGNTDSALFYVNKAIEISPSTSIYHVSRGLFMESIGRLESAFEEYKYALRLKPVILNSEFYKDLSSKYPEQTDSITQVVKIELKMLIDSTNSPIYKSRLGILYFYCGQIEKAKNILNEAVEQLPNLNRPWYFLGKISECCQLDSLGCNYFKKSLFLDPKDYLAPLSLGDYYFQNNDTLQAISYYTNSLYNIIYLQSDHFGKNWRMYHVNTLPNNIIPRWLLSYCSISYPYTKVLSRLASLYSQQDSLKKSLYLQRNNAKRAEHYKTLINISYTMDPPPISIVK